MMPFCQIAYANEIVPEPSVAATSEKIEPEVPPALNLRCTYLVGDKSCKTKANLVKENDLLK